MTKKVNNLIYGLPEEVSFHRAVEHDSCTELFISVKEPKERVCPHCGSHACMIKDSGRKQIVRHTHVGHQAVILTFHAGAIIAKTAVLPSCSQFPDYIHL